MWILPCFLSCTARGAEPARSWLTGPNPVGNDQIYFKSVPEPVITDEPKEMALDGREFGDTRTLSGYLDPDWIY